MNNDIKVQIMLLGLKQWQVADEIGITPCTFCVWLRHELSAERRKRIDDAIDRLSKGGVESAGKSGFNNQGNRETVPANGYAVK